MTQTTHHTLCDECQTVAHCAKKGCIPKADHAQHRDDRDDLTIAYMYAFEKGKAQAMAALSAIAKGDAERRKPNDVGFIGLANGRIADYVWPDSRELIRSMTTQAIRIEYDPNTQTLVSAEVVTL